MSARLFRRIKSSFSRLNKTFFFSIVLGLVVLGFSVNHVFADPNTPGYKYYFTNFSTSNDGKITSGLTGGTVFVQSANKQGGDGLVFTATLGVNTSTPVTNPENGTTDPDNIALHWLRVYAGDEAFVVKVCQTGTTQCYLNTIPGHNETNRVSADAAQQVFTEFDEKGNATDKQTLPVVAFTKTSARNTGTIYKYDPAANSVSSSSGVTFASGSSLSATLWYCGAGDDVKNDTVAYLKSNPNVNSPTFFDNLCGGRPYFQIGAPLSITVPADATAINQQVSQSQSTIAQGSTASSSNASNLPVCGIGLTDNSSGTVNGCLARVAYGLYVVVAWIAGILGSLFDFFLGYSVADTSYRYDFAVNGWKLVRDISNVFFIIIMVWTGFSAVFDTSKSGSMKRVVPALIVNALLINFSLFATRVVIDISNITARMFYSQMVVCEQVNMVNGKCDPANAKRGPGGYWPLSEKIVSAFNPQQLFKNATLQMSTGSTTDTGTNFNATATTPAAGASSTDYANYFLVVCLVAVIIMGLVGYMFYKISFLFIGRVVGLYMCMIFSPFAFLSQNIPMLSKVPKLRWSEWTDDLIGYALMAPVFVFFLYIIFTILTSDFAQQIGYKDSTGSFLGTVMGIAVPLLIIFFLVDSARKMTERMSGDIGKTVAGWMSTATGLVAGTALGVASGGVALAGTSGARLLATSGETRTRLEAQKAAGGIRGQFASAVLKTSDWTQKQSFNFRDSAAGKTASRTLGINPNNNLVNRLGFSSARTAGGREGQLKRAETATKNEIESVKSHLTNPEDVKRFWANHVQSKKMQKQLNREAQAAFKEQYGRTATKDEMESADFQAKKAAALEKFGNVTDNKKLTQALRVQYADSLLNENTTGLEAGADVARTTAFGATGRIVAGLGGAGTAVAGIPIAALTLGALTDNTGKRNSAKAFLDAQKKAVADAKKKKPRAEKLAEQNKELEEQLKAVQEKFNDAYRDAIANDPKHAGKTVDYFNDKANAAEAKEVIDATRNRLKNQHDETDLDVQRFSKEYDDLMKGPQNSATQAAAKSKLNERNAAIAKRNAIRAQYEALDQKRKKDLENNIDRNESEQEKINDREKAAAGK